MIKINDLYTTMIFFQPELWKKLLSTASLAEKIGKELGALSDEYVLACYYMNIGYFGISRVINASIKLNEDDKKEIRRHPKLSSQYLEMHGYKEAAKLVLNHHERPDGMGYYGEQKYDKRSAFLNVADVFIGQISPKPYCSALTIKEANENFREVYERSNLLDSYEIKRIENILLGFTA